MDQPETSYVREPGYADRYRDQRFADGHGPTTDRLERRGLARLLKSIPAAAEPGAPRYWLDMPAGAGRLTELLPGPTVQVDRHRSMLVAAGPHHQRTCATGLALPFHDGAFRGALCMRLMQHIGSSTERVAILTELRRVTRGPLIVSFFDSRSFQHARRLLRRRMGKPRSGRVAVPRRAFMTDLLSAGWEPVAVRALRRFWSEQTLVLAVPQ